MKKFSASLGENAKNLIGFEKKKIIPLINEELKLYEYARICYICGKYFLSKLAEDINHR